MFLGKRFVGPASVPERDEIVTTFCEAVTPRCEANISRTRGLDIKYVGEAMASASERNLPSGGANSGAGAAPVLLLLAALFACNDEDRRAAPIAEPTVATADVADLASGVTTELD